MSCKKRATFKAAVYLLIFDKNGRVLLQKRNGTDFYCGYYGLPSGHMENNESSKDSMIREAKEELCIDISPDDLDILMIGHNKSGNYISFVYQCLNYSGVIQIGEPEKCNDLAFFELSKLPENTIPYIKTWLLEFIPFGINYSEVYVE